MENEKVKSKCETNKKNTQSDEVLFIPQNSEFPNSESNEEESKASKQDKIGIELIEKAPDNNFDDELEQKIERKKKEKNKILIIVLKKMNLRITLILLQKMDYLILIS